MNTNVVLFAALILLEPMMQGVYAEEDNAMTFKLTSTAFAHEGAIPKIHTCQGQDISPPLAWSGVPANAKSLVLIIDDPDAPDPAAPKMTWVHWVLYNIAPSATGLPQGVSPKELPRARCKAPAISSAPATAAPARQSAAIATFTSSTRSTSCLPT